MKTAINSTRTVIQWTWKKQLDDLDFVDDIVLLSHTQIQMHINIFDGRPWPWYPKGWEASILMWYFYMFVTALLWPPKGWEANNLFWYFYTFVTAWLVTLTKLLFLFVMVILFQYPLYNHTFAWLFLKTATVNSRLWHYHGLSSNEASIGKNNSLFCICWALFQQMFRHYFTNFMYLWN